MDSSARTILLGGTPQQTRRGSAEGRYVELLGEAYYRIGNFDALEPFFMSLVSSSDHWLFISSSGGLTAGRENAEQALFPYYTEDKLTENSENTGGKTLLLATRGSQTWLWEPFSARGQGQYALERNLYKNVAGTALVFEEVNHSLGLTLRYAWRSGEAFGFVKTSWLVNTGGEACQVDVLDGLQNLLPANVSSATQNIFSPLLDGYKRSELDPETGLGIFALNSRLTDLAEPSESLLASTAFQVGLTPTAHLLSSQQLERFRAGGGLQTETEVRGRRAAYFVHARVELAPAAERAWHLVADVQQDSAAIVATRRRLLQGPREGLMQAIEQDLAANTERLRRIVASADGLQCSADPLRGAHHFANTMFNVMRGGIFADPYQVERADFRAFVDTRQRGLLEEQAAFFKALPARLHLRDLQTRAESTGCADLVRLSCTYLPLTFSRRHGDPSRPWNRFSIRIKQPDGSQRLDYEGNWRDIFQNWEALACSFPEYVEGMIFTFLGATTADGYNPYRITRAGLDWETPEPGNPWANIGYWSDHQIIYLEKLMELSASLHPGRLRAELERPLLSYANVPYRIRPFDEIQRDPYNTIQFDHDLEREIGRRVAARGSDGKLVHGPDGRVLHASLAEKLLTLLLAKLVNFVPEGGIWMNTQRPEWNDANNALVGRGLSVVTLGYLRRYIAFCRGLFGQDTPPSLAVRTEVAGLFGQIHAVLQRFEPRLSAAFDDAQRRQMLDALGQAGSAYRADLYARGLGAELSPIAGADLLAFLDLAQRYIEHSLRANRRADHLYHAYNILHLGEGQARVAHLYEMLEGQVSILSSGMLTADESLTLLESLRQSALYRADQHSYILYPDRVLPGFLQKSALTAAQVSGLGLPAALAEAGDRSLLVRDADGVHHFSGQLRNAKDLQRALEALSSQPRFAALTAAEGGRIAALFEEVFRHSEFTGRSGTFFAYEGLGSIYWHMVSKLLLAVQEAALRFQGEPAARGLAEAYRDIRAGLGTHKSPAVYGAFPTDPYSHTPRGQGARQPGMTGAVKEEILTRQAELGLRFEGGCLAFDPLLLEREELLTEPAPFEYLDLAGNFQRLDLERGSLAFTVCQVPVIVQAAETDGITVQLAERAYHLDGLRLDEDGSRRIFQRDGSVQRLLVRLRLA